MKFFAAALAVVLTTAVPTLLLAKGDTVKITIERAGLSGPIETTDPNVRLFNVWSDPGTLVNGVPGRQGFIIDWSKGIVGAPAGLHPYKVSFYKGCEPKESSACHGVEPSLAYVVLYEYNPATEEGFVYLPGGHDEFARLNTTAIYRGTGYEGHWFRATKIWDNFVRPIIPNEAPRLTTAIPPMSPFYWLVNIGNTVVATVQVSELGTVKGVRLLQGVKPFTDAAVQAISQWKFQPAHLDGHPVGSEISAVMMWRPPYLSNIGSGGPSLGFTPQEVPRVDHPVLPMYVIEPGWPVGGFFISGEVIYELSIRDSGSIGAMRVVHNTPSMLDFAKDVVRKWDFTPAVKNGKPVPSVTIVGISFVLPRNVLPRNH
jgi:Gram-negative bacterial TonB protein C-terminal